MKNFFVFFMAITMICISMLPVDADEINENIYLSALDSCMTESERADILQGTRNVISDELYMETAGHLFAKIEGIDKWSDIDFESLNIIPAYFNEGWNVSENSLESIKEYAKSSDALALNGYLLFNDDYAFIVNYDFGNFQITYPSVVPGFINDILTNKPIDHPDAQDATVLEMYACSSFHIKREVILYLVTDKGTFVKYYEDEDSEAVTFTKADFEEYGGAYWDSVYKPTRVEDIRGDGSISFASYIASGAIDELKQNKMIGNIITYTLLSFVAAAICFVSLVLFKKRKTKCNA